MKIFLMYKDYKGKLVALKDTKDSSDFVELVQKPKDITKLICDSELPVPKSPVLAVLVNT